MSEIKSVSITGGAAADMMGGAKRRRGATKKRQEGGANEPIHGVSAVMTAVKGVESPSPLAASAAAPNSTTWLKYPPGAPVPPAVTPEPSKIPVLAPAPSPASQQQGGTKHVKVELKKKAVTKKVHLNPKKAHPEHKSSKKHQTKKVRKVTIGVSSLHKRITRAKKVHKAVKDMPIDKLKERLIKGGLIKPTSTAPEAVLRQIARDAEIVKNKAL